MREDADFMVYVGARWPSLVRTLVLLGCPEEQAAEVAISALARCRRGWSSTRQSEDVDLVVHQELLDAWDRHRRGPWWESATGEQQLDPDLVRTLDALPTEQRADLVLQRFSGLQSGRGLPPEPSADRLRGAAERVLVLAPPSDEQVREHGRRERVRRQRRLVAIAVPLVLVLAGVTWATTQAADDGDDLGPASVTRAENPAEVAWFAQGELHLDHVIVRLSDVRDVTVLGNGAVYGDGSGRVVYVADDGVRTLLGHKRPDHPVAASDETGWAAWVEEADEGPRLVVYEASTGNLVGRTEVEAATDGELPMAVAVDGDAVYYHDAEGTHAWFPTGPVTAPVTPAALLDVRSRIRAFQVSSDTISVVQSYFSIEFTLPGRGASLSPDGNVVLTRLGESDDSYGQVAVYDTRSGEELPTGLTDDDVAVAAAPGPDGTVTYIVARAGDRPRSGQFIRSSAIGQLELRTCDLREDTCETLAHFPSTGSTNLLAR